MSDRDTGLESSRQDEAERVFGDGACRAEGLKSAILHLAEQIAAADRRQSEALQTMQQKLTRLGGQTEAVKAALPVHLVAAFERIEVGMAQLADQLAQTDHPRAAQPQSALPDEAQTELAFVPADAIGPMSTAPPARDANEIHPPHMEPASQQFDAPPPLKSAIGLQPPGTWGSREVVKHAEPVFVQNPDEPWDAASAAELSRLYESGEAGIPPLRSALDEQPRPDAQQPHQPDVATGPALAGIAPAAPAEAVPQEPLPLTTLVSNVEAGVGADWLDSRLNEMAARIEQSLFDLRPDTAIAALGERFDTFEAKLTSMLDGVASRSDVEGLRLIEAHISELAIQVEEARARLDRLDQIERQLGDLQATLSDDEILRKFGGIVPTEEDLVRFAEEAATRAAGRVATGTPSHGGADQDTMRMFADIAQASQTAQSEASRQMLAMQDVFARYMDERRRGEAQTAEALETLQHAMQHMLDRVDAIEMRGDYPAQMESEPYAEPAREMPPQPIVPRAEVEPTPEALQRSFAEQAKAAAARMSAQIPMSDRPSAGQSPVADRGDPLAMHAAGDHVTTRVVPQEARPQAEAPVIAAGPEKGEAAPGKPQDRQAFIAMARRAAEQAKAEADRQAAAAGKLPGTPPPPTPGKNGKPVSAGKAGSRPGILVAASLGAFLLAGGFWVMSSPKFRSFNSGITFGKPAAPPKSVVPVEPAAKVPADPRAPAIDEEATPAKPEPQPTAPDNPGQQKPRRTTPETGIDDLGHNLPKGPERKAAVDMPVENIGLGVAVEHGPNPLTPEDIIRARQKAHVAQLSQRTAQDAARIQVVPQDRLPNGIIEMAKADQPEPELPAQPAERNTVELPPATIGPMSLRLAAGKGDPSAQFEIAVRFAEGKGVRQDFAQAAVWYQRAATKGMPLAQYRLAGLLERGLGITADPAKARIWYKRAAEQGNLKAMHNLAVLNAGRNASPAELAIALKWFGDAADRGLADSQFNLAVLLETGMGVEKDPVQAYKWYALAARSGDKEAARRLDQLKTRLEPEQVKAAEAAIGSWRSKPVDRMVNDPRAAGEAWKHTANAR